MELSHLWHSHKKNPSILKANNVFINVDQKVQLILMQPSQSSRKCNISVWPTHFFYFSPLTLTISRNKISSHPLKYNFLHQACLHGWPFVCMKIVHFTRASSTSCLKNRPWHKVFLYHCPFGPVDAVGYWTQHDFPVCIPTQWVYTQVKMYLPSAIQKLLAHLQNIVAIIWLAGNLLSRN
jgi:hypothetical protein